MKPPKLFPIPKRVCLALLVPLLFVHVNRCIFGAQAMIVDLISDAEKEQAVQHGLIKLKLAFRDKGLSVHEGTRLEAGRGGVRVVAGLATRMGPAATLLKTLK